MRRRPTGLLSNSSAKSPCSRRYSQVDVTGTHGTTLISYPGKTRNSLEDSECSCCESRSLPTVLSARCSSCTGVFCFTDRDYASSLWAEGDCHGPAGRKPALARKAPRRMDIVCPRRWRCRLAAAMVASLFLTAAGKGLSQEK